MASIPSSGGFQATSYIRQVVVKGGGGFFCNVTSIERHRPSLEILGSASHVTRQLATRLSHRLYNCAQARAALFNLRSTYPPPTTNVSVKSHIPHHSVCEGEPLKERHCADQGRELPGAAGGLYEVGADGERERTVYCHGPIGSHAINESS